MLKPVIVPFIIMNTNNYNTTKHGSIKLPADGHLVGSDEHLRSDIPQVGLLCLWSETTAANVLS